MVIVLSC